MPQTAERPVPSPRRPRFVGELDTLIRARYPLVYLVSSEEPRVDELLRGIARGHGKSLIGWTAVRGLHRMDETRGIALPDQTEDPFAAVQALRGLQEPALVVLKDLHAWLDDRRLVRALRELGQALKSSYTTVLVLAPVLQLPVELEKDIAVLDVPLPTFAELADLLRDIVGVLRKDGRVTVDLKREEGEQLIKAALGLTLQEAENAFAKAIADDDRLDASDIQRVMDEKRQVIRKSGLLEYYPVDHALAAVGGLQSLKDWLHRRARAFSAEAHAFGLPEPRGLLLLGVQGCGKSLTAKAIASQWALPLLRLDMGRVFSGLVGSSEENLRRAIRVAESAAPAVLWLDEIDKALSGSASSNVSDGGTTARVLGTFLTWLQEKTAPVFVVATANRVEGLPPELLRKGRFDEIFFIDLPDAAERQEILRIHLSRRGRAPEAFDLAGLAARAEQYSGAELEQAVVEGLHAAFHAHTELTDAHLAQAISESVPLAVTLREEIARIRAWAADRTRPASPAGEPVKFLSRFQRLERARAEAGPARSSTERFEALEPAAPLPDVQSAPLDRFAAPVVPPLELQPRSEAQPFVRCPACGVDSALGTRRCRCGAALDTLEVVSFNAELWDRHRAERARLETEQQGLRAAQLEAARSLQQERQALGEAIAREVAARERGSAPGAATVGWALMVVALLALVLLPHGTLPRVLLAVLLGAVAVRVVVGWVRARARQPRPRDESTVRH